MGIKLFKRATARLIILIVLAGVATYIMMVVSANIIVWHRNDNLNAKRLKLLQADGILQCRVAKISPWHEKEERNADMVGSTRGIGFGGRTLTSVTRVFSLNGADPANVISAFTVCAQSNGWMLAKQPYIALSGTKSFPDGWTASLSLYIGSHTPFANQPIIQVNLTTDPI